MNNFWIARLKIEKNSNCKIEKKITEYDQRQRDLLSYILIFSALKMFSLKMTMKYFNAFL